MGIIKGIAAVWKLISWLRSEKKAMEADVDGYLTQKRAVEWRIETEKIFRALQTGGVVEPTQDYENFKNLPRLVKWFFNRTTIDNRAGQFGQWFLKSKKLKEGDEVLNKPYRMQ